MKSESAQMSMELKRKNVNDLHSELGYTSKDINHDRGKAMGFQLTGMFECCDACALVKAQKAGVRKMTL